MWAKAVRLLSTSLARSYTKKPVVGLMAQSKKYIEVPPELTLTELAHRLKVPLFELQKVYLEIEELATANSETIISRETSEILINEYGCLPLFSVPEEKKPRPPVITIMGHVDHGKTTLLDSLRNSKICDSEFGGITQGIGAFTVKSSQGEITVIDTPGHLAFKNMRARGAEITDIIVLVICAVEGVQPQTMECIEHARNLDVPLIIALNKIDLPAADPLRVENQLLKIGIELDKYGGDVMIVPISAKKKIGLDKLEEAILFKAELMELKETFDCRARGFIIESRYVKGRGNVCSVIVKRGTLKVNDPVTSGCTYGTVKSLLNEYGKELKSIGPAQAAEIIGFKDCPVAGDPILVVHSVAKAIIVMQSNQSLATTKMAEEAQMRDIKVIIPKLSYKEKKSMRNQDTSMLVQRLKDELEKVETGQIDPLEAKAINQLHKRVNISVSEQIENISKIFDEKPEEKNIRLILKANNYGMLEAVQKAIETMAEKKGVKVYIIKANVGTIAQEDLDVAAEYDANIFCMNVSLSKFVLNEATKANISIKSHKIIYHLLDDVEKMIHDLINVNTIIEHGKAQVKNLYDVTVNKSK